MLAKTAKTKKPVKIQKEVAVMPILAGVIACGLTIFVVIPAIQNIKDRRQEAKMEQAKLDKLVVKRQALEQMSPTQMTEELVVLEKVLPVKKPIVGIIGSMAGVAEAESVALQGYSFTPGLVASEGAESVPTQTTGKVANLGVDLNLGGVFGQVVAYMRKIQESAPLTKYLSATLKGTLEKGLNPDFTAEMAIDTYYALPPETKGKLSDPLPPMSMRKDEVIAQAKAYQNYEIVLPELEESVGLSKPNPFQF